MSPSGAITLGALRGKLQLLEIACSRCDRAGRLRLDRLLAHHGAAIGLPDLRTVLAGDCPRIRSVTIDRCGVHFPQLPGLFAARRDDAINYPAVIIKRDASAIG